MVVAGEVKNGVAEDYVREIIGDVHLLNNRDVEVTCWKVWRELGGEGADMGDGTRVGIDGEDLTACAEEVDEIAAVPAASVEDAHGRGYVSAEDLIEDIDVDLPELLLQLAWSFRECHVHFPSVRCAADGFMGRPWRSV